MNGPEHYREADVILRNYDAVASQLTDDPSIDPAAILRALDSYVARAQAHVALAQVAATIAAARVAEGIPVGSDWGCVWRHSGADA